MIADELQRMADFGGPMMLQFVAACLVGGLLGYERQRLAKPVGMLTSILVTLGAAVFTGAGLFLTENGAGDPSRIPSTIASGIGFVGAGAILRSRFKVSGLASAATIWALGALGILIGSGYPILALALAVLITCLLWIVPKMEHMLFHQRDCVHIQVVVEAGKTGALLDFLDENQVPARNRPIQAGPGRTRVVVNECGVEHRSEFMQALRRLEGVEEILP